MKNQKEKPFYAFLAHQHARKPFCTYRIWLNHNQMPIIHPHWRLRRNVDDAVWMMTLLPLQTSFHPHVSAETCFFDNIRSPHAFAGYCREKRLFDNDRICACSLLHPYPLETIDRNLKRIIKWCRITRFGWRSIISMMYRNLCL